jgi:hypothetical protein
MKDPKKIYFAHPVSDYNKPLETKSGELIAQHFPQAEILNPNQKVHNDAYLTAGMAYFENLVKSCDTLVAIPFPDGEWGMGVWREAEALANHGGQVFELNPDTGLLQKVDFKDIRPLSINETRKRVKAVL